MMRVLVDTHVFMWMLSEPHKLPLHVRDIIKKPDNDVFVNIISLWEIITKRQIGKLDFSIDLERVFLEQAEINKFNLLRFELSHLTMLETLPLRHRDPFDRALIAQAKADNLTLVSRDAVFSQYPVSLLW
jgi:PIN domain nuclease of toxin-antitoxin system